MKKTRKILALGLSFVMMLGLCLTAGTVNATEGTTQRVTDADGFIAAANNPNIDVIEIAGSISINTTIEGDDGFGQITNKTIKDVRTTKSNDWHDNLLNIVSGGKVTFNGVNFVANENTKNLLSINGNANVTLTGITYDHTQAYGGAPIVVKDNASILLQEGQVLDLGKNSWYGINVDGQAAANFDSANIQCNTSDENNTQSVVCLDSSAVEVSGLPYSQVVTAKDGGSNNQQIAFVKAEDLADFIMAKTAESANVERVNVTEEIPLYKTLTLSEEMIINFAPNSSAAFVAKDFTTKDNVVTVTGKDVVLNNVKIVTNETTKSGLHIYGGTVVADELTVDNRNTAGGAAVVLNGGTLELKGTTTFQLGENSWGGINIDNRSNVDPVLNVADGTTIDVTSPEDSVGLYYVDEVKQNEIPLNTAVNLPDNYTFKINGISGTIDANGELKHSHQATRVPAKEATYDATGNIEYWYCAECDKYFADAALTKEISKTDTVIPKLEKPGQPVDPEKEMITITLKAIVDGKEINLEELGLKPEQYILPVEKGIAFTADDLKVLDEMKESLSVDGYTFRGYFLDAKGTEALKADVPFNADATIYMIWDKEVDVTVTPNPGDTEKPNTEKPNTDNTNKPEQKPTETDKTVKTDDSSNAALYGLMISLSVVGAGIVVLAKKREELLNK